MHEHHAKLICRIFCISSGLQACAVTVRFSAMMRLSNYPCLLTSEPVTATLMTNIIALQKEVAAAPARICKDCASAALMDFRHALANGRKQSDVGNLLDVR